MILWTFCNRDGDGECVLCIPFTAHVFDFDVNEAVILVKLAQAVQVLLQLRLVESAGLINKGDDRFALGFHFLAQPPVAEVRVPLETDLFHRAFRSFVHGENHPRRPTPLIN